MSGWVPVFDSVFTGTLCGRYPDTAAWLFILALADKNGIVDMTPQAISALTGMPVADLLQCIDRFEQPDPHSRTGAEEGRRLVRLDPERPWGWRVVNHSKYREKARLQSKNAREVAEGRNAQRMEDRRRPPETASDPLSNTNTNTNTDTPSVSPPAGETRATRLPGDFGLTPERMDYALGEGIDPQREFSKFTDHFRSAGGANARKRDWDAAWRNWCRRAAEAPRRAPVKPQPSTWRPPADDPEYC